MPCYDSRDDDDKVLNRAKLHFLTAALCHAVKHLSQEQLIKFPGLASWKSQHDKLDEQEKEVESGDRWDDIWRDIHQRQMGKYIPAYLKIYRSET